MSPAAPDDARPFRTLVVRVWLPDRPGALGLVASRIGAVHGDVLAIDILERGGGQAVDELLVSVPLTTPEDLLVSEIDAVDGVAVESVRPAPAHRGDPATALFALAADVAERCATDREESLTLLGERLADALDADWVVIQGREGERYRLGSPPEPRWLEVFLDGSGHLGGDEHHGPADVMWARLPAAGLVIAVGRAARAAHEYERSRLRLLARIVDPLLAVGDPNGVG